MNSMMFMYMSYRGKTKEICYKAIAKDPEMLKIFPNYLKAQEESQSADKNPLFISLLQVC